MRTGRPKQPLSLTEEERERLQALAHRARSQPSPARRARVVLTCAEGLDNQAAARSRAVHWDGRQVAVSFSASSAGRAL
jgi:hypothetical protein